MCVILDVQASQNMCHPLLLFRFAFTASCGTKPRAGWGRLILAHQQVPLVHRQQALVALQELGVGQTHGEAALPDPHRLEDAAVEHLLLGAAEGIALALA